MNQAVSLLEPRLTARALRSLAPLRKYLLLPSSRPPARALAHAVASSALYAPGSDRQQRLLDALGNPPAPEPEPAPAPAPASADMDIEPDSSSSPAAPAAAAAAASSSSTAPAPYKKDKHAGAAKKPDPNALPKHVASHLPEADAYLSLLVLLVLLDSAATSTSTSGVGGYAAAQEYAAKEIEYFARMNRRTMDQLMSKFYFYWVRAHEIAGADTAALRP